MSRAPGVVDVGHGILRYEGDDPETIRRLQDAHTRVLDVLWLPCALAELAPEQILLLNRFRELAMESDAQFSHAHRARKAAVAVCEASRSAAIFEVGCGKFPIIRDVSTRSYFGLDIDPEAIRYGEEFGIRVGTLDNVNASIGTFDLVISLYAFHFSLDDLLFTRMRAILAKDAILFALFLAESADHFLSVAANLSTIWPHTLLLKEEGMARREVGLIAGGADRIASLLAASDAVRSAYRTV